MNVLLAGEYSGDITHQSKVDDAIVTNTVYSSDRGIPSWHCHENLHVCLVFHEGKSETRHSSTYADRTGSIFFYRSGEQHRWISAEPDSTSLNIEVGREFLTANDFSEADLKDMVTNRPDARMLMLKMQSEVMRGGEGSHLAVQSLLLALFSGEAAHSNAKRPLWVTELRDLLNDEWHRDVSLAELAKILGIHPVTISKYFRKYFGCTLGEYRRSLRVRKSIGMIRSSAKSLTEIALECGFADQSHFTRTFKNLTGFLPRKFRDL